MESKFNLEECTVTLNGSTKNGFDIAIQTVKTVGFVLHLVFFAFVIAFKEFHTQSSVYLINLAIVSFINLLDGMISYDPDFTCNINSRAFCIYQSMFIQYYSYLYSYAVVLLAAYRLACSNYKNLTKVIKISKIVGSLLMAWILPVILVVVSKYTLNQYIIYSDILDACRIDYKGRPGGFIFFVFFGFVFPTLIVAIIYGQILIRVKSMKSKVNTNCHLKACPKISTVGLSDNEFCNQNQISTVPSGYRNAKILSDGTEDGEDTEENSVKRENSRKALTENSNKNKPQKVVCKPPRKKLSLEFKLLIQFLIIFLSYFTYSLSNIVLTYQLTVASDTDGWSKDTLKIFRLLIWVYHLLNPIIFLSFHPIFINKFKQSIFYLTSSNCKS